MNIIKPEEAGFSSARLARMTSHMQKYVDAGKLGGVVTLLARRGEVLHFACTGRRHIEADKPMQADTIFRIYSMTKPITTVAAMMLFEEGHFVLDDPVARFIPAFAETKVFAQMGYAGPELVAPKRPITLRDLMMHTSGLSYGFFDDSPVEDMYRQAGIREAQDLAQMVERIAALPLIAQPGARWQYSFSTDVLGRVVEVISGQSLHAFLQEKILGPLDMGETGFWVAEGQTDRLAATYGPRPEGGITVVDAPESSVYARPRTLFSGGGGLVSTAPDYLRFALMLRNRGELDGVRLLAPKTIELMTLNHAAAHLYPLQIGPSALAGYGFGLGFSVLTDVAQSGAPGSLGTYGWSGAATTQFWIDPVEDLIGMIFTQFMPSGHYPITREFRILAYQALMELNG